MLNVLLAFVAAAVAVSPAQTWTFPQGFDPQNPNVWRACRSLDANPHNRVPLDWDQQRNAFSQDGDLPRIALDATMIGRNRIPNQQTAELAVLEWTAPTTGVYRVTATPARVHPAGGDGCKITTIKETTWGTSDTLYEHLLMPGTEPTPLDTQVTLESGDHLLFTHFAGDDAGFDEVRFEPTIELIRRIDDAPAPIDLPLTTGQITVDPSKPFDPITLHANGQSLVLLKNIGPMIEHQGQTLTPESYTPKLFRLSHDPQKNRLFLVYRIAEIKAPTYYWITIQTDGPFVYLDFEMREPLASAMTAGQLADPDAFKPFTMMRRLRESWEVNTVQAAFRHREGKFWVYGQFDLERSNACDGGVGCIQKDHWPTHLAPDAHYPPYAANLRRPLRERLTIGVADDLWTATGSLANPPSQYGAELGDSMFLDLWGGGTTQKLEFLKMMRERTGGLVRFYTIVQTWQAGGFDGMGPDAFWPERLMPADQYGSFDELKALVDFGLTCGRIGLRTNYNFIVPDHSPSFKHALIKGSLVEAAPGGDVMSDENRQYQASNRHDWLRLARFQETDIHTAFNTNAQFVDQLASGGGAGFRQDLTPWEIGAGTARADARLLRQFADAVKEIHHGPLSSETLNSEYLLGRWCDTGDYGIFNGDDRLVSPEYKLHRLHHLSTFHGMGLSYRFFSYPQQHQHSGDWLGYGNGRYWGQEPWDFYEGADAYRAMTVLYGNGAYYDAGLDFPPAQRSAREHALTEALTVGILQPHYALQPVERVLYRWKDQWLTLNDLMDDPDIAFKPDVDDCPAFKTIRVQYANGLTVVVNRDTAPFELRISDTLTLSLPHDGWAAYTADLNLLVYSAVGPLAQKRIDFTQDKNRRIRFINPRSQSVDGVAEPTLWIDNKKLE